MHSTKAHRICIWSANLARFILVLQATLVPFGLFFLPSLPLELCPKGTLGMKLLRCDSFSFFGKHCIWFRLCNFMPCSRNKLFPQFIALCFVISGRKFWTLEFLTFWKSLTLHFYASWSRLRSLRKIKTMTASRLFGYLVPRAAKKRNHLMSVFPE